MALCLCLVIGTSALVTAAMAVDPARASQPAAPGIPQPGRTVYAENFENTTADPSPESYSAAGSTTYAGLVPSGQRYTASPDWLDGAFCNGVVLDYDDNVLPAWATTSAAGTKCSTQPGVQSYQFLRLLAQAMGRQFQPGSPDTNHVVSTYTECAQDATGTITGCPAIGSGPIDGVLFQTRIPVSVTSNHFFAFSADTAFMNCGSSDGHGPSDPQLQFALLNGTTSTPIGGVLPACAQVTTQLIQNYQQTEIANFGNYDNVSKVVNLDHLVANSAFQYSGSSLGVQLYNNNGASNGNDGALDNVEVVDVTPQLDKAFSPTVIHPGGSATLTYTITNTAELNAKNGWNFTDVLPAGLTAVGSPSSTGANACIGFTGTAPGGRSISVAGNLTQGQTFCTVSVPVTGHAPGSYTNSAGNFPTTDPTGPACNGGTNQGLCGLNPPGSATLSVVRATPMPIPGLAIVKTADRTSVDAVGQVIHYRFRVTNTGNMTMTGVAVRDTQTPPAHALAARPSCPRATLPPSESEACIGTYVVSQSDLDHGSVADSAIAIATPSGTSRSIMTGPSSMAVPATQRPGLALEKWANKSYIARAGESITYTFRVTNTGNVTLYGVRVTDYGFGGTGTLSAITCPAGSRAFAPGTTELCTANYVVTAQDVAHGAISNSAVVSGSPHASGSGEASGTRNYVGSASSSVLVRTSGGDGIANTGVPTIQLLVVGGGSVAAGVLTLLAAHRGRPSRRRRRRAN